MVCLCYGKERFPKLHLERKRVLLSQENLFSALKLRWSQVYVIVFFFFIHLSMQKNIEIVDVITVVWLNNSLVIYYFNKYIHFSSLSFQPRFFTKNRVENLESLSKSSEILYEEVSPINFYFFWLQPKPKRTKWQLLGRRWTKKDEQNESKL